MTENNCFDFCALFVRPIGFFRIGVVFSVRGRGSEVTLSGELSRETLADLRPDRLNGEATWAAVSPIPVLFLRMRALKAATSRSADADGSGVISRISRRVDRRVGVPVTLPLPETILSDGLTSTLGGTEEDSFSCLLLEATAAAERLLVTLGGVR